MPEVLWYYARKDEQFGPVSASELKQLADDGRLSPDDLLWRDGMDAWTTAINLRGLLRLEDALGVVNTEAPLPAIEPLAARVRGKKQSGTAASASRPASLQTVVRATQAILWCVCVMVVLAGVILFTRAFLAAEDVQAQAASGAVYSTFIIAAYVLARAGDKLSRLLLAMARRRSR